MGLAKCPRAEAKSLFRTGEDGKVRGHVHIYPVLLTPIRPRRVRDPAGAAQVDRIEFLLLMGLYSYGEWIADDPGLAIGCLALKGTNLKATYLPTSATIVSLISVC